MPQTALLNLGLNHDWDAGDDAWKAGVDNNWALLDAFALGTVIDQRNAQPGAPAAGDAYITGAAATGAAWAGHNNELAVWNAATSLWVFAAPTEGWTVYDLSTRTKRLWDGAQWLALGRGIAFAGDVNIATSHYAATLELDTSAVARDLLIQPDSAINFANGFYFYVINRSGANNVTFTLSGLTTRGIAALTADRQSLRIVKVGANTWISS